MTGFVKRTAKSGAQWHRRSFPMGQFSNGNPTVSRRHKAAERDQKGGWRITGARQASANG
jgi:hypothetical protein